MLVSGLIFFFWSQDGSIDFSCNWVEYKKGLCSLIEYFWLGLSKIHCLTPNGKNTLRVNIGDFSSYTAYAQYSEFKVLDTTDEYAMAISGYVGTAGDYFGTHDDMKFSTKDRDQGMDKNRNCAETFKGGWWFHGCYGALSTGPYIAGGTTTPWNGIIWYTWRGAWKSFKFAEIKVHYS